MAVELEPEDFNGKSDRVRNYYTFNSVLQILSFLFKDHEGNQMEFVKYITNLPSKIIDDELVI